MARHFLKVYDFSKETLLKIFNNTIELKKGGKNSQLLGQSIGLFFEKSSTRTRVSFEVGIAKLGGNAVFLNPNDIQINRGESIEDTANVLSRYLDGMVIRTFSQELLESWAEQSRIPIINGLTDKHHPCQGLTDVFTVMELMGGYSGRIVYIGDANNVLNSLMETAALVGIDIVVCCPEGYGPDKNVLEPARKIAEKNGSVVELISDPVKAVAGADFVYTDVWTSMGQELEEEERKKVFRGYQINMELLSFAKPSVKVLHCLPAKRGEEITEEVMDNECAVVFDQAENRLHVQKAILIELLGNE